MNTSQRTKPSRWARAVYLVPLALLVAAGSCVVGVLGYFHLSADTAALRQSAMQAIGGTWDKTIAVNVGGFTTALVRLGARFFPLEPEPRAAIETVRGGDVGVYTLRSTSVCPDRAAVFTAVDRTMSRRGWERVVGVSQERDLVAVYIPHRRLSPRRMRACVMVFHDRNLVVASARGNLDPLLVLAAQRIDFKKFEQNLALR